MAGLRVFLVQGGGFGLLLGQGGSLGGGGGVVVRV